jgi:hypothetical protein
MKNNKAKITYIGKQLSITVQGLGSFQKAKTVEFEITPGNKAIINSLKNDKDFKVEHPGKEPEPLEVKSIQKEKQEKKKGGDK